ncbi:YgjV family protein [Ferrimonas balearica]|uniref:YgjV family protein n=1 Tax=Ferrimonas balearica TaxID=44012 RepID=UPI0028F724FF|nr:YgjV family protein [Ferrimonas balearica]
MSLYLLAQALGFLSMGIGWWANSQSSDHRLLRGNLVAAGLTAAHLGLLGSPLGMSNQMVNAARFALAGRGGGRVLAPLFAALALAQGWWLASHWSEWCVVAASVISSYLLFHCRGRALRWGLLLCNALNLTLSVTLLSWSGCLYQVVTMALLLHTLLGPERTEQPERG